MCVCVIWHVTPPLSPARNMPALLKGFCVHTHSKNSSIISLARLCLFITQLSVREKMPSLDDRDRVVGPVLRELESGTYEKTFLVLDFGSHTLYGYAGRPGVRGAHTDCD